MNALIRLTALAVCVGVFAAPAQARVVAPSSDLDLLRPLYGLVWVDGGFKPVYCPPGKFCW
jgi:hypothetical protein